MFALSSKQRDLNLNYCVQPFALFRSSSKAQKSGKLPVTPSTATLSKSQKNKGKKKTLEKKGSKPTSPIKNTTAATTSSQVCDTYVYHSVSTNYGLFVVNAVMIYCTKHYFIGFLRVSEC